ncbi:MULTISPECIES: carbohydrate ABC transporter permease [unclassified Micromonospora]|uniref:carbohydrate ABC transporter permease n=1 Tax=unclassified Micromonospora TaxID=2617518 RepID=UPI0022B6AA49|nr:MULTISPECIES: carbohydrate ABC transporter permease [unclassified Micromonospora]MCZ7422160.1 carbohydrate ABC transporter permease [Verrucosispora sp. WMMA2121]WBB89898.1 carbohydrate ABC transporter permease [Verrucosispora sp. WMMC514]
MRPKLSTVAWHAGAIALLAVVLYPIGWVLAATFKPTEDIIGSLQLLPTRVTTANYDRALDGIAGISVVRFFWNSTVLAVLSVVGTVATSAMAAYAFARLRFRGRSLMFVLMISTLLLPFHVLIIPQYVVFQKLELVDTYAPLLLGKFLATEAFFVFLMVQFMRAIPHELDDSAKIDGAGHWGIFWHIVLPLSRPAIITTAIFTFIWTWNDFFGPLIYLSTPDKYPLPLALQLFIDETAGSNFGALMAMSMLALVPVILFFLFFQRFLVEGVSTSGLKG